MFNDKLAKSLAEAAKKVMDEELKGNQHKIDANKNNKIDSHDFKLLRAKKDVKEEMQKADVPAYLRKQQGEKPLTMADVKGPRKDSISSKENLAKARNEESEKLDELSKDTLKSYMGKAKTQLGIHARNVGNPGRSAKDQEVANASAAKRTAGATRAGQKLKEQVTEADVEKTATGMKVYGSSYGNSVRARREQTKRPVDDVKKEPTDRELGGASAVNKKKKFSEMVETYVQTGIKGLFESFVKEEVTNDQFKKELDKQKAKADGKAPQADVAKAAVQAVQNEESEQLDELSPGTLKSYSKGAKMDISAQKDQKASAIDQGDHKTASDSAAAIAKRQAGIKQAKSKLNAEEVEELDEISLDTMKSAKEKLGNRAFQAHMDDNKYAAQQYAGRAMNMKKKIAQKERQVTKEEVEQLDELSPGTLKSYVNKAKPEVKAAKAERNSAEMADDYKTASDSQVTIGKRTAGIKQAKSKLNKEDTEEFEVVMNELNGYAEVTIGERSLTEPEMKKKEDVVMSMKKGLQGFKDRYGADAKSVMYATATKIAKKD